MVIDGWKTTRVMLSVALPPGPKAVIVYVVVSEGDTVTKPLTSTLPIPESMTQESEFVEVHDRVHDSPNTMVSGSTDISTVGGYSTVTVTLAEVLPPAPEAVIVYVVLPSGDTIVDPFRATLPMPGWIEQVSAWVESQERMLDSPTLMDGGEAEMLTSGGGAVFSFSTFI